MPYALLVNIGPEKENQSSTQKEIQKSIFSTIVVHASAFKVLNTSKNEKIPGNANIILNGRKFYKENIRMRKKVLFISILVISLVCLLSSCEHEHNWSVWEIDVEKTCTTDGIQTRHCIDSKCGEVESQTLYAKGHTYSTGKCTYCGSWMPLNVTVPDAPLVTIDHLSRCLEFTKFDYGWKFDSNSSFDLYLYYDAEMMYGLNNTPCYFRYKVIDSEGYTVGSGNDMTTNMSPGDKVKNVRFCVASNLDPNGSYTIIISDYQ